MLNQTILYRFHRQPFVLLFCAFSAGILLANSIHAMDGLPFLTLITISLFIGLEISGRLSSFFFTLLLTISLFLLGMTTYQLNYGFENETRLENVQTDNTVFGVDILEVSESESDWLKCIGSITQIYSLSASQSADIKVLLFIKKSEFSLVKGDQLLVSSTFELIKNNGNPGEFDAKKYWSGKGIQYLSFVSNEAYRIQNHKELGLINRYTDKVRGYCSKVLRTNFEGQEGAVLSAIVLGDKSMLSAETRNSFMNTGAMHVLAVSGLHVGLILYLLLFIAERFSKYVSKKNALIAILLFLWIYALVTGMSPSVIRAVFMFSMLSLSQLSSRDYSPINILFFTAFVLLVYNPLYIFDIGFQLSYLAMLGIFLFYPKIEAVFSVDNWLMKKIWQGTTIGLAAQILTTPLSLYYFHQFPNYFMLSNLGLMATSGIILGLGISILAVAKIPFLVKPFTVLLWLVLFCTLYFLSFIEKLPGAVAYGYDLIVWQGLMVIVASLILFYSRSVKYKLFIAVPLLLFSISWISFNRYERMSDDEICVFSNSKPLISLKKNGVVHCFYKSTSPKDFEKAAMIMSSYTKLYPGKLVFHELKKQSVLVEDANDIIAIEPKDGNYRLKVNNKEYTLVLKSGLKTDDYFDSFRIGMPWVEGGVNHSLRDGAYQIQL